MTNDNCKCGHPEQDHYEGSLFCGHCTCRGFKPELIDDQQAVLLERIEALTKELEETRSRTCCFLSDDKTCFVCAQHARANTILHKALEDNPLNSIIDRANRMAGLFRLDQEIRAGLHKLINNVSEYSGIQKKQIEALKQELRERAEAHEQAVKLVAGECFAHVDPIKRLKELCACNPLADYCDDCVIEPWCDGKPVGLDGG